MHEALFVIPRDPLGPWNAGRVPPGARRLLLPCPRVRSVPLTLRTQHPAYRQLGCSTHSVLIVQHTVHVVQSVGRCTMCVQSAQCTYVLTLPPSRSSSERGSHLCRARSEVGQSDADPLPGLWRLLYLITFTFSVFLLVVSRVVICSLSVCLSLRRMSLRRLCELAHRRGRRPTPDTRRPTVSFRILVLRTVAHWLARYSSRPPTTRFWPRPAMSREPRRSGLRPQVRSILGRRSPAGTATTDA